jgi:predicted RNase H-like HicB family nuclease
MKHYIALIRKDPDSSFGVEFPDFPGCISAGDTLGEAATGAAEALALHVDGIVEDGQAVPEPSTLDDIDTSGAVPILVPLPEQARRVLRLNITMAEGLVRAVDEAASRRGLSRSAFLATAARGALR